MEVLLLPISLIVGCYIITRLSGINVSLIMRDFKAVFALLVIVVPFLGLVVALSVGAITPGELCDRTAAIIQSTTVLLADHLTSVVIGAVATPIAVFLISAFVRPIMDAFDL